MMQPIKEQTTLTVLNTCGILLQTIFIPLFWKYKVYDNFIIGIMISILIINIINTFIRIPYTAINYLCMLLLTFQVLASLSLHTSIIIISIMSMIVGLYTNIQNIRYSKSSKILGPIMLGICLLLNIILYPEAPETKKIYVIISSLIFIFFIIPLIFMYDTFFKYKNIINHGTLEYVNHQISELKYTNNNTTTKYTFDENINIKKIMIVNEQICKNIETNNDFHFFNDTEIIKKVKYITDNNRLMFIEETATREEKIIYKKIYDIQNQITHIFYEDQYLCIKGISLPEYISNDTLITRDMKSQDIKTHTTYIRNNNIQHELIYKFDANNNVLISVIDKTIDSITYYMIEDNYTLIENKPNVIEHMADIIPRYIINHLKTLVDPFEPYKRQIYKLIKTLPTKTIIDENGIQHIIEYCCLDGEIIIKDTYNNETVEYTVLFEGSIEIIYNVTLPEYIDLSLYISNFLQD